jgi:hypothetical protein
MCRMLPLALYGHACHPGQYGLPAGLPAPREFPALLTVSQRDARPTCPFAIGTVSQASRCCLNGHAGACRGLNAQALRTEARRTAGNHLRRVVRLQGQKQRSGRQRSMPKATGQACKHSRRACAACWWPDGRQLPRPGQAVMFAENSLDEPVSLMAAPEQANGAPVAAQVARLLARPGSACRIDRMAPARRLLPDNERATSCRGEIRRPSSGPAQGLNH